MLCFCGSWFFEGVGGKVFVEDVYVEAQMLHLLLLLMGAGVV